MFKKIILSLVLSALLVPSAFAASAAPTLNGGGTAATTDSTASSALCYDSYGCGSAGISISVYSVVSSKADSVILYGTYNVYEANSKKDAVEEMASAFSELKAVTADYGVLTRTSLYTYADWQYTNLYDGTLSVRLELTDHSALNDLEEIFYEQNFDNWADIQVTDTNAVKKGAISDLKDQIKEQKSLYEEILDYSLTKITGLSIYTTVDTSTYDPDTDTVDVTVWADVTYQGQ